MGTIRANLQTSDYVQYCRLKTIMLTIDLTGICQQSAAMQTNLTDQLLFAGLQTNDHYADYFHNWEVSIWTMRTMRTNDTLRTLVQTNLLRTTPTTT